MAIGDALLSHVRSWRPKKDKRCKRWTVRHHKRRASGPHLSHPEDPFFHQALVLLRAPAKKAAYHCYLPWRIEVLRLHTFWSLDRRRISFSDSYYFIRFLPQRLQNKAFIPVI